MKYMVSVWRTSAPGFLLSRARMYRGFTLVELLVVLAIIGVLVAVGIPSFNESRERSRDAQRISDLKQLEFALEVYHETHGAFPDADGPTVIGEGNPIDEILASFLGRVPRDPLGSPAAGDDVYEYVYDPDSPCGVALYAKTMEREENVNSGTTCSELSGRIVALGGWDVTAQETPENPPLPNADDQYTSERDGGGTTSFTVHTYDGHTYYASDEQMSIEAALEVAADMDGHLVTISDQAENDYVAGLTDEHIWLGLYQNNPSAAEEPSGAWQWVDGTPLSPSDPLWSNWNSGEPNDYRNGDPGEDYAVLNWNNTGKWNDWYTWQDSSGVTARFIVEYDYQE